MLNIWRGQKKCAPAVFRYLASGLLCAAIASGAASVMAAVTVLTETASDPPAEHLDGDALPDAARCRSSDRGPSAGHSTVNTEEARQEEQCRLISQELDAVHFEHLLKWL